MKKKSEFELSCSTVTSYIIKYESIERANIFLFFGQVREIIVRHLRITREVPIMRVKRQPNGPEVRGCKPVTVYFEKWQDKDDILRKSNMLRGANIFIGEDFSKRVRDQVKAPFICSIYFQLIRRFFFEVKIQTSL